MWRAGKKEDEAQPNKQANKENKTSSLFSSELCVLLILFFLAVVSLCRLGNVDIVQYLIDCGADINMTTEDKRQTTLHLVCLQFENDCYFLKKKS